MSAARRLVIAAGITFAFPQVAVHEARALHAQSTPARQNIAEYNCMAPGPATPATIAWKQRDSVLKLGEWRVALGSNALPVLVIVTIVTPGRTQLTLDIARDGDAIGPWTISNAPSNANFALNAGQFTDNGPWGWVVHRGREHQPPGVGSLAGALVVDSAGRWALLDAGEIQSRRSHHVLEAVQSYPTLIAANGRIPQSLCAGSDDINRSHRDTRLAVGTLATGELVIAMTRFDGLGAAVGRLPLGPTTPEMISIMRALGATRALMLDGGLSAQLMVRAGIAGVKTEWPGLRSVPLALVGLPVPTK